MYQFSFLYTIFSQHSAERYSTVEDGGLIMVSMYLFVDLYGVIETRIEYYHPHHVDKCYINDGETVVMMRLKSLAEFFLFMLCEFFCPFHFLVRFLLVSY